MTNNPLDIEEIRLILADGRQQVIEAERRMAALIEKVVAMHQEVEDPHTCALTLHIGESRDKVVSVKAVVEKRY